MRLTHERPDGASRHILHDVGEDRWRLTRDDARWTVDIQAIDRSDHSFDVVVRRSASKRSVAFIEDLLSKHLLREKVRIDVLDEP